MLKEDKDYFELATKVSTMLAEQYLKREAAENWPDTVQVAIMVGMGLQVPRDSLIRDLKNNGHEAIGDFPNVLMRDEVFMEILVDDLNLSINYIDFDSFMPDAIRAWDALVDHTIQEMGI
jgi:hypothetical protein